VTNYHVAANESNHTLVVMTRSGDVYAVKEVLAASHADDLAILALDAPDADFQPLALSSDAPVGAAVSVISHPDGRFFTMTRGIVSRYFRRRAGGHETTMVAVTADFARGSSGCPVIDDRGAVVALVASTVSVYYNESHERQENLQMVFKQCVPAASVLRLVESR
jgi:S1-C subfamily serine protease